MVPWRGDAAAIRPMLATLEEAPLESAALVYEPKYDGIRAIVEIAPGRPNPVRLWSRLGNEKTAQFPDLVAALTRFAARRRKPLVLDGEVVALDERGEPAGFQRLQNRIHLTETSSRSAAGRVALIAFDILRDGDEDLRPLAFTGRRQRLERAFGRTGSPILRISDVVPRDGRALFATALERGWEGLIAKDAGSVYHTGKRTRDWRKLKIVHEQEFVIGGWTDSRTTGRAFGALLLGYYEDGRLVYAGHTGSGFDGRELDRVMRLLKPLETPVSPFATRVRTNERPHWVQPSLVAQVKFTEWTDDAYLRHPIYLGTRDDVKPENVKREQKPPRAANHEGRNHEDTKKADHEGMKKNREGRNREGTKNTKLDAVVEQLSAIEKGPGSGTVTLPDGITLEVTNLRKVFWPKLGLTKGDLLRYYAQVAPNLLPVVKDRPLIMKRFPNGVGAEPFYQHKAPDKVPAGVITTHVDGDNVERRFVGGGLATLLYMTQLAAISQDPWFSRVQSPHTADHCAIDLDPMPGVKFSTVREVARWVHEELTALKVPCFAKTSGSRGLHIFIPLQRGTPYEAGQIFCQIVATMVAEKHPRAATVERTVRARGQKVYIDCLQNIEGKSLACAYSARASEFAGASAPVTWEEIADGFEPADFTIRTLPSRVARTGDLWAPLRTHKGIDLRKIRR